MVQDKPLSVLVVDDSVVFRLSLYKILETFPEVGELNVATGGKAALEKVAVNPPDLMFCDIEMPEEDGDGLYTLSQMKKRYPETGVIMISSMNEQMAKRSIHSLTMGAVDFIPKPTGDDQKENERYLRKVLRPYISLFSTRKYTSTIFRKRDVEMAESFVKPADIDSYDGVFIGGSSGAARTLMRIIPSLPASFELPVFIVQQMESMFTSSLAEYLGDIANIPVKEAENGEAVLGGTIYIAPGDRHMVLTGGSDGLMFISLNDDPPVNFAKPSIDMLFSSASRVIQNGAVSVILSGMGKDGIEGVRQLKSKGCFSIVQDSETSPVSGLPDAVAGAGCSDEVLPDREIGDKIVEVVSNIHVLK